ncbi:hypothetical protein [Streptomyces cucumeris]|uniref:hypothetical protein n=1 Tax=Streptomyces cucumeris TaxID=2962890 RepID=UPI003D735884
MGEVFADPDERDGSGDPWDPWDGVDAEAVAEAARQQAARPVPGVGDMASSLAARVADDSHRDVIGPLLHGGGASGAIVRRGVQADIGRRAEHPGGHRVGGRTAR